jgi:putative copper export protein
MVGGLLLALFVLPRLAESAPRRRAQFWLLLFALAGTLVLLAASAALLVVRAVTLGPDLGRTLPQLLRGTDYGTRWLVSTLLAGALAILLAVLCRQARRGRVDGLAVETRRLGAWALLTTEARVLLLAVLVAAATAVSGHASGAAGLSLPETLVRIIHLVAMGVWAGGVVALALALAVLRRAGDRSAESALKLVVGFGPYAAVGLASLAVTGLLLSGAQVASVTALLSTPYGTVLVAKVIGVGLVAVIALRHALLTLRGLRGRRQPSRSPRALLLTLTLEGGGALTLVLLAAVLSSSAPARGPQFEPQAAAPVATVVTMEGNSLLASVSVKPNRAGPNLLSVQVVDTRRPAPAAIERVTVLLQRPGGGVPSEPLPTTRSGNRYDAGTVSMVTGDLRMSVVINRTGLGATVIDVPWRVYPPEVRRAPTVISSEPLAPLVDFGAVLLAGVAALAFVAGLFLRARAARLRGPSSDDSHAAGSGSAGGRFRLGQSGDGS